MSRIEYRPDIDGLRAFAVLGVVLFHAGFPVYGGYVGVDVFFVISGFLITSLMLKDMAAGNFSFAGFWERRARRIFPALTVTILATLAVGWIWFLPEDFTQLGREILSQSIFASNMLFYEQAGYFDTRGVYKALLHTWSLAVEEQFYLFYPLFLWLLWHRLPNRLGMAMTGAAALSFVLCLIVASHNQSLAFYMLPSRGWELLAGAILAATIRTKSFASMKAWHRETIAAVGALLIASAMLLYTDKTSFPGWATLVPCLGTVMIIWANGAGRTICGSILSFKPIVFVGLVSYSWYLWHWPVIVFLKYDPMREFNHGWGIAALAVSFALAVASWRFVEQPVRAKRIFTTRRSLFAFAGIVIAALAATGLAILKSEGFPNRFSTDVLGYAASVEEKNPHRAECEKTNPEDIKAGKLCQTNIDAGAPSFIFWGDSHADALAPLFFDLSKQFGKNGYIATHAGCPPVIGHRQHSRDKGFQCTEFNDAVLQFIKDNNIRHVFLSARWTAWSINDTIYFDDKDVLTSYLPPSKNLFAAAIDRTIALLNDSGADVTIIMDIPSADFDPPRALAIGTATGQADEIFIPYKKYKDRRFEMDRIRDLRASKDIAFLDPSEILCQDGKCKVSQNGHSLYYDWSHVSVTGAKTLSPLVAPSFKRVFARDPAATETTLPDGR